MSRVGPADAFFFIAGGRFLVTAAASIGAAAEQARLRPALAVLAVPAAGTAAAVPASRPDRRRTVREECMAKVY
jgi:hypothetical protein